MCNLWLHMTPLILLRKKNVVKRRADCFQKVNHVRTPTLWVPLKGAYRGSFCQEVPLVGLIAGFLASVVMRGGDYGIVGDIVVKGNQGIPMIGPKILALT
jgi:hypothetical protein